jgi:group I intron endonuclease
MIFVQKEAAGDSGMIEKSGIYQIKNIINNKLYIGSARNFRIRFNDHIHKLKRNRHPNKYLQNVYNQNPKSLAFTIIEIVENWQLNLLIKEQEYLNVFHDKQQTCYNMCPTAGSAFGRRHSEETKKKMSRSAIGQPCSIETRAKMSEISKKRIKDHFKSGKENPMFGKTGSKHHFYGKHQSSESILKRKETIAKRDKPIAYHARQIAQYDMEGNLIQIFKSVSEAERQLKNKGISSCMYRKAQTSAGFVWRDPLEDGSFPSKIDAITKKPTGFFGRHSQETIEKIRKNHPSKRSVQQFDKLNQAISLETYSSLKEASRKTGIVYSTICACCKGKRPSAGGFIWKYLLEKEPPADNQYPPSSSSGLL